MGKHVTQTETDLMKRLVTIQNADTSRDIMSFAGFMNTREELEAYVMLQEKQGML